MRFTLLIISLIFATGVSYAQMEWSAQSQVQLGKQANSWRTGMRLNARNIIVATGLRVALPQDQLTGDPGNFGTVAPNDWSEVGGYYVQLGLPLMILPDSGWYVYTFLDFERFKGTQRYYWTARETSNSTGALAVPYEATASSEMFAVNIHFVTEFRINQSNYVFGGIQYGESRYKNENCNWYRSGVSNAAFYFGYRYRIFYRLRKEKSD